MLEPLSYLEFAIKNYPAARYDLASSGAPPVTPSELGYEAADDPEARQRYLWAIAGRYQVPVAQIIPTLGGSGAIHQIALGLMKPGQTVAVETPYYEPLWQIPKAFGLQIKQFHRSADPEELLAELEGEPDWVVLSNPHNPSGKVMEEEAIKALAERLGPERYLIIDEVYRELYDPITTSFGQSSNIITINSATKCLGVPWARAGWIVAPEECVMSLRRAELYAMGQAPPASFAWGAASVEQSTWLIERVHRLQAGKRELVFEWLARHHATLSAVEPFKGSLFTWVQDRRGRDLTPLIEQGFSQHGVIVGPGVYFGAPDHFRLSFTLEIEELKQGLKHLEEILQL